jgi:hypothetical protein
MPTTRSGSHSTDTVIDRQTHTRDPNSPATSNSTANGSGAIMKMSASTNLPRERGGAVHG